MPIENDGQNVDGDLHPQALVEAPRKATRDEYIPADSTARAPGQNEPIALQLEQDIRAGERWLIGLGFFTLLVNSLIALIYWGQLQEMRKATKATQDAVGVASRTLTETERSNARQAVVAEQQRTDGKDASDVSAATAKFSLDATINNFHQEQRAWLGVTSGHTNPIPPVVGQNFDATFTVKNTGHTPALETKVISLKTGAVYSEKGLDFSYKGLQWVRFGLIPPDGEIHITLPLLSDLQTHQELALSSRSLEDMRSGATKIFIHGVATYKDVYRNAHFTSFCYALNPNDLSSFYACSVHNDADTYKHADK